MCQNRCTHLRKMVYFWSLLILDKCFSTVCACFHSYNSHQVIWSFHHYCSKKKKPYFWDHFWDQMISKLIVVWLSLPAKRIFNLHIYQLHSGQSYGLQYMYFIHYLLLLFFKMIFKWLSPNDSYIKLHLNWCAIYIDKLKTK